jgi:hypothetical protein
MLRPIILAVLIIVATAGLLFLAAGRFDWLPGWLFLATPIARSQPYYTDIVRMDAGLVGGL